MPPSFLNVTAPRSRSSVYVGRCDCTNSGQICSFEDDSTNESRYCWQLSSSINFDDRESSRGDLQPTNFTLLTCATYALINGAILSAFQTCRIGAGCTHEGSFHKDIINQPTPSSLSPFTYLLLYDQLKSIHQKVQLLESKQLLTQKYITVKLYERFNGNLWMV
jgi:hypothetical protein